MITLFIIGIIILTVSIIVFVCKAAFGIIKSLLCIVGFPLALIVIFILGLSYVALPLLIVGIIVAVVFSFIKKA